MNKEELISLINSLEIDLNECCILSTGALVIRDLYSKAGDLDLLVTQKGFEQLNKNYNLKQKDNGWYVVNDKVECLIEDKNLWHIERYDSYILESLDNYYNFILKNNRPKDLEKKNIIEDILSNSEFLTLLDENKNVTNEKILRKKGIKPVDGRYINIVIVFIENSGGKFLIQKTSKEKGSVFATTGGLVKYGATNDQTIVTEIKEELGINVDINDLKLVYTEKRDHIFQDSYYLKMDIDIDDLTLQKEEVEYVEWLSVDEINSLINNGEFRKGNISAFEYIVNNIK